MFRAGPAWQASKTQFSIQIEQRGAGQRRMCCSSPPLTGVRRPIAPELLRLHMGRQGGQGGQCHQGEQALHSVFGMVAGYTGIASYLC